jgi:hypothetical protein
MSTAVFIATDTIAMQAREHNAAHTAWAEKKQAATADLLEACVMSGSRPIGYATKDPMGMSIFGIVFSEKPGPAFVDAPAQLSNWIVNDGGKGLTYMPNLKNPVGKMVYEKMLTLSAVNEAQPLLWAPGVRPAKIDKNELVMSRVVIDNETVKILASPRAITPNPSLRPASSYQAPTMAMQ